MAERKGFDTSSSQEFSLNLDIENTEEIDSSELDSFLSDADPTQITPVNPEKEESPKASEKKESKPKVPVRLPVQEEEDIMDEDSFLNEDEEEEEPKKKEKETPKAEEKPATEEEEETSQEEEYNPFTEFSKELYSLGLLSKDENGEEPEITTGEQLAAAMQEEKLQGAQQILNYHLSKHGEKHRDFLVAVFNGVDPEEYFATFSKIESFEGLDLTKEENQKAVFREFYRRQGLKSEKIEKLLQKSVEDGDLEEFSNDYHQIIVDKDKIALDELKTKRQQEQAQKDHQDKLYDNSIRTILGKKLQEKEFDGIPVNNDVANNAYDFLYSKKYQLDSGELITEFDKYILELKRPENHELRVKIALLALNNFDLGVVKPSIISKETDELFASIQRKNKKSSTTPVKPAVPKSTPTKRFNFEYPQ